MALPGAGKTLEEAKGGVPSLSLRLCKGPGVQPTMGTKCSILKCSTRQLFLALQVAPVTSGFHLHPDRDLLPPAHKVSPYMDVAPYLHPGLMDPLGMGP